MAKEAEYNKGAKKEPFEPDAHYNAILQRAKDAADRAKEENAARDAATKKAAEKAQK